MITRQDRLPSKEQRMKFIKEMVSEITENGDFFWIDLYLLTYIKIVVVTAQLFESSSVSMVLN